MNKARIILSLYALSILGFLIWFNNKGFYEYTLADFDLYRFPLIEPYELYSTEGQGWCTSILNDDYTFNFPDSMMNELSVDSVGMKGSLIFLHGAHEYLSHNYSSEEWFVYDNSRKKGAGFSDPDSFYSYLHSTYKISDVKFYHPAALFKRFQKNCALPPEWPHEEDIRDKLVKWAGAF